MRRMPHCAAFWLLLSCHAMMVVQASAALASADPCLAAADFAARETGVPRAVLTAITLAETGRQVDGTLQPWAWALNAGGEGFWLSSRDVLRDAAEMQISEGHSNFDLGCFQLNYRWHGEGFSSLEAMIDPQTNALYAARFLAQLYEETGDWSLAAAAYHSRTPEYAERYRARFDTILAALDGEGQSDAPAMRQNLFPLLRGGIQGARGSVVPLLSAQSPLIKG